MDDTKRVFAEALRRLQRERRGAKITVTDIAEAAGFDRHTFYYHFSSLFDLLVWMFEDEIDRLSEIAGSDWARMIEGSLEYSEEEKELVLSLFHSEYKEKICFFLSERMKSLASEFLRDSERMKSLASEFLREKKGSSVPEEYIPCLAEFLAYGTLGLYFSWLEGGMEKSAHEVFQELEYILGNSLKGFSPE